MPIVGPGHRPSYSRRDNLAALLLVLGTDDFAGGQQIRGVIRQVYSHSIVPGGLDVTSRTTRLISRTSLVIRVEIRSSTS
jgi:hypothetical protein